MLVCVCLCVCVCKTEMAVDMHKHYIILLHQKPVLVKQFLFLIIKVFFFLWYHITVVRSQPLIFSQLAFYLHDLGDTASVTSTVIEIRDICDKFAAHGLPNYPMGIIFTFWEQYLNLRFYLMLALVCVLAGIFLVLSIVLMSPWTAFMVVSR